MDHSGDLVFVGTYTQKMDHVNGRASGIYVFRLVDDNGRLEPVAVRGEKNCIGKEESGENPTYLCTDLNKRYLFSVQEIGDGEGSSVSSFAVDRAPNFGVRFINNQKSKGLGGCHISSDEGLSSSKSRLLFVSHYVSGSFSVLPVQDDGSVGQLTQTTQFDYHSKNQQPHAHSTFIDDSTHKFAFVADLGGDRIYQYVIDHDSRSLKANSNAPFLQIEEGSGPRHMVFHPSHRYAYIINELNATVTVCRYDSQMGTLSIIETVSTRGKFQGDKIACAAIRVSSDGRALYASNRFHNSIAVFLINQESGKLEWIQDQDTFGEIPRDFVIDNSGKWLLVANQETDSIITFKIDPSTRMISKVGETHAISPVCLCLM